MSVPLFPSLSPKIVNPVWFCVDRPSDEENELTVLETEHQTWMTSIAQRDCDQVPIGKTATEEEDEEEEEDDDNDDDTSESHDEEEDDDLDMDVNYGDGDSPNDVRLSTSIGGSSLNPVR